MSTTINGTSGVTFPDGTNQTTSPFTGGLGFRNRIINGDFRIDQRNAGASVTPAGGNYTLDRWMFELAQPSKLTCQQNAGSVTPPTGFTNYLGVTSTSTYTSLSTDYFWLRQAIEGFNVADLGYGTAAAATTTLSFWVRSSLTGTFSGCLGNSPDNRAFPFIYTIGSANTWTYITISVPGDTTGTWLTNNNAGLKVFFNLGTGSSRQSPAGSYGSWVTPNTGSNDYRGGVAGTVSVIGTNGATFYITGVQLEKGSTATSFDYRPYGTELHLCKRYAQPFGQGGSGRTNAATEGEIGAAFEVQMRATPTITLGGFAGSSARVEQFNVASMTTNQLKGANPNTKGAYLWTGYASGGSAGAIATVCFGDVWFANAEL